MKKQPMTRLALLTATVGMMTTGCVERRTAYAPVPPPPVVVEEGSAVVVEAPPPPREEVIIVRPSPAHVWVAGHWGRRGGEWVWVGGSWTLPPRRYAVWVPGHWVHRYRGWVWVPGHWRG